MEGDEKMEKKEKKNPLLWGGGGLERGKEKIESGPLGCEKKWMLI